MNNTTFYLLRYSCPLFIADTDRMTLQLVGTSVPFSAQGRQFLITAKHVLEWHGPDQLLYPTNGPDPRRVVVSGNFVGASRGTVPGSSGFDNADLAILEVPPGNLSSFYSSVPRYIIAGSITLKHVDRISLIGYPVTRNKYRSGSRYNILKSVALEIPHEKTSYDALGLNPVTHFCAKFNQKEMNGPDGRGTRPLQPNGLSGGPAWNVTETAQRTGTDEGASLLGIVSAHDTKHNVIWGPRLSYAFLSLADAFPELADSFKLQGKQRTFDPEEAHYFRRATGNA